MLFSLKQRNAADAHAAAGRRVSSIQRSAEVVEIPEFLDHDFGKGNGGSRFSGVGAESFDDVSALSSATLDELARSSGGQDSLAPGSSANPPLPHHGSYGWAVPERQQSIVSEFSYTYTDGTDTDYTYSLTADPYRKSSSKLDPCDESKTIDASSTSKCSHLSLIHI